MQTTTTARPVKINLAMDEGPLRQAIKQILPVIGNKEMFEYVNTADEADLVIFTDVRRAEQGYSREKSYVYFPTRGSDQTSQLPENCTTIGFGGISMTLNTIDEVRKTLKSVEVTLGDPEMHANPWQTNILRILVIDDTPKHIASAREDFVGTKLATATGYEEAMRMLEAREFDAVLTDLHLSMSSSMLGNNFRLGALVPYGILLMIEAARCGAKYVAVVTDLSHHDDPFSAAFDHYSRFPVKIEGAKVAMMHSPMNADGSKDWATALKLLTEG